MCSLFVLKNKTGTRGIPWAARPEPARVAGATTGAEARRADPMLLIPFIFMPTSCGLQRGQAACKPGSVPGSEKPGDDHSSGTPVTGRLARPTRAAAPKTRLPVRTLRRGRGRPAAPIWSCSRWGLPCRSRCRSRGALLPHLFTLACRRRRRRSVFCGTFPGVTPAGRYPAPCLPWSPDFPPRALARPQRSSGHLPCRLRYDLGGRPSTAPGPRPGRSAGSCRRPGSRRPGSATSDAGTRRPCRAPLRPHSRSA